MSSYDLYGGDALIGVNRNFSNPESDISFPLSDLINLWSYGLDTWNAQSVDIDTMPLSVADADPLSVLNKPNQFQYKWKSHEGSTLVLAKTSNKSGETDHDYQKNMAITFKSSSGDQMTYVGSETATSGASTYNVKESGSLNYKYVGDLLDKTDNLIMKFSYNSSSTETHDSNGVILKTEKKTVFSESIVSDSMQMLVNATVNKKIEGGAKNEIINFSNYKYQDNDNGFSLAFKGEIQNHSDGTHKYNITNIAIVTDNYKLTSAILQDDNTNYGYDLIPENNYQQITSGYFGNFEEEIKKAANIIKITNTNGALVGGGDGADRIIGNIGDDFIHGGTGKDILTGGAGSDNFIFANDTISIKDVDTITDFVRGVDVIALKADTFTKFKADDGSTLQVESSNIIGSNGVTTTLKTCLYFNINNSTLYYDDDGSGSHAATAIATLTGVKVALDASDFYVF